MDEKEGAGSCRGIGDEGTPNDVGSVRLEREDFSRHGRHHTPARRRRTSSGRRSDRTSNGCCICVSCCHGSGGGAGEGKEIM